jgi:hypothetical protein
MKLTPIFNGEMEAALIFDGEMRADWPKHRLLSPNIRASYGVQLSYYFAGSKRPGEIYIAVIASSHINIEPTMLSFH